MLGQKRDVDNGMFVHIAQKIEPADRRALAFDHQKLRVVEVLLVMRVLRLELLLQEGGLLPLRPGRDGEFLGTRRRVEAGEKRQVGVRDRPESQPRLRGARPAEGRCCIGRVLWVRLAK